MSDVDWSKAYISLSIKDGNADDIGGGPAVFSIPDPHVSTGQDLPDGLRYMQEWIVITLLKHGWRGRFLT